MNVKLLKILINLLGILCLAVFIIASFESIPIWLEDKELIEADETGMYGDLYFLCRVDYFKTELPRLQIPFNSTNKKSDINESDILIYGDSYFGSSRVLKTFPEIINDSLNLKVYFEQGSIPLKSLINNKFKKNKERILLYETTERRIMEDFKSIHQSFSYEKARLSNILNVFIPYNSEMKYLFILQKSAFTSDLYSFIVNFKFNTMGLISDLTPMYSKNPPFLFYYQNVNNKNTSFYYKFSEDEIINVANNISDLSKKLKVEFNLDLVFFPIPSSYTINHKFLNNDVYNGFLPGLYKELDKRNVKSIKLFDKYYQSEELLYYPTDSHWNEAGMRIAYDKIKSVLNQYYFTK